MHCKDESREIFRDFKSGGQTDISQHYFHKMKRLSCIYCLDALNQAIKFKALHGLSYFKAMLTRTRITRRLFVMEVEMG